MSEAQTNNKIANSYKTIIAQGALTAVFRSELPERPELVTNILPTTEWYLNLKNTVVSYKVG